MRWIICVTLMLFAPWAMARVKVIEPHFLYMVSSAEVSETLLRRLKITDLGCIGEAAEEWAELGLRQRQWPLVEHSSQRLDRYWDDFLVFMDRAKRSGGRVLVHSSLGEGTMACFAAYYLMTRHQLPLAWAWARLKPRRGTLEPLPSFARQLRRAAYGLGERSRCWGPALLPTLAGPLHRRFDQDGCAN